MNKQEAIDEIENAIPDFILNDYQRGKEIGLTYALELVKQLDEPVKPPEPAPWQPEKPVVPRFVADYIASEQRSYSTLSEAIDNMDDEKEVLCWSYDNSETFAKAWLFGYEVEKEKLYTVEIPNPNAGGHVVLCRISDGIVSITFAKVGRWRGCKDFQLTESEIKKDFEWAWQFAKEVEYD